MVANLFGLTSLLFNSFYFNSRVSPVHGPLCQRQSLLDRHEILKGEHHHTLGEGVTIPFGKLEFSFIK